ncbi:VIT1/CCC1 transporter family protein [Ornatilinea apprima]|uniref:VIT1/CCC1 transporter family protein n=1 Tax=Ornatilinea apprima TaxID=1134406 RepID=UPI000A6BC8D4|nr:VIT1/CCC1 transporter family protein [Ornatilinea apprima]
MTTTQANLGKGDIEKLLFLQQDEINSHHTYARLAKQVKDENNSAVLKKISEEEKKHYEIWNRYTRMEIRPNWFQVNLFYWLARILGLTFGIKLMELGEEKAQKAYSQLLDRVPEAKQVMEEEEVHEEELMDMLDEEGLKYAGSVVLGLNDALVELTGALAGFSFAFQKTNLIALAGLITGISASFSMAASEYLSQKSEEGEQDPLKSAIYTGVAYIFTVLILVLPYFLFQNYLVSLAFTVFNALVIIAVFNFYISVAKGYSFKRRFTEMALISVGVAAFSFIVGVVVRNVTGIEI